jgi:hypothetical protein
MQFELVRQNLFWVVVFAVRTRWKFLLYFYKTEICGAFSCKNVPNPCSPR